MDDYWSLEEIEWRGGKGVEGLAIFGINPIKTFTNIIDDLVEGGSYEEINNLNFLIRNMLENMGKCIFRFLSELGQKEDGSQRITRELEEDNKD